MSLQQYLKITLTMVNSSKVNVQLRGQGFDIPDCNETTDVQFTPEELSVAVRALEVNQALPETFDQQEWELLEQWNVVSGEFDPTEESGEIKLHAEQIDIDLLIKPVQDKLFYTLFPKEDKAFGEQLAVVLSKLKYNEILHIRLEIPFKEENELLHRFPWEVLCLNCEHFKQRHTSIARYIQGVEFVREIEPTGYAKGLIVRSRPMDKKFNFIQLATDRESIRQRFSDKPPVYRVQIKQLENLTNRTGSSKTELLLREHLDNLDWDENFSQFLHFECHGKFGRRCLKRHNVVTSISAEKCTCGAGLSGNYLGYLAFEQTSSPQYPPPEGNSPPLSLEVTQPHWISGEELASALQEYPISFVFLNTCESAVARRSKDTFNGVVQSLIRTGIPAVMGTSLRVESEAARKFAQYFYQHLCSFGSIIEALNYARQQLSNDGREWYRFVLYFGHSAELSDQFFIKEPAKDLSEDFSGKDLSDETLCGWDLEKINLSSAILSKSLLKSANLKGANLFSAKLDATDFSRAVLIGANLSGGIDLSTTIFFETDLTNAILEDARFYKDPDEDSKKPEIAAILKYVNLTGANLSRADLTKVKLSDVQIPNAKLNKVILNGAELADVNFKDAELNEAVLTFAKLTKVNFEGAQLNGANFSGAELSMVNFRNANLQNANFEKIRFDQDYKERVRPVIDFDGADLTEIKFDENFPLRKVNIETAILTGNLEKIRQVIFRQGNDFRGVDLSRSTHLRAEDLSELDFSRANFSYADLRNANLSGSHLSGADLSETKLGGANLQRTRLYRANLSASNLFSDNGDTAVGSGVKLRGAELQNANLSGAILLDADLRGANLEEANLDRSQLNGAKLIRANLQEAIMTEADLSGADLTMADLHKANLQNALLQGTDLTRSNLTEVKLENADLSGAILCHANLTQARLRGANLRGADLRGAILGDINLEETDLDLRGATLPNGKLIPEDNEQEENSSEELETDSVMLPDDTKIPDDEQGGTSLEEQEPDDTTLPNGKLIPEDNEQEENSSEELETDLM